MLHLINEAEDKNKPLSIEERDGEEIRNTKDTDFIAGGHHYAYPWIEDGKIIIEKNLEDQEEKLSTAVHEITELILMSKCNMKYDQAHEEANKYEKAFRDYYVQLNPKAVAPDTTEAPKEEPAK